MTVVTGIVVYILIWWLTLFTVLPWRVQPARRLEKGHAAGAPERPMIFGKLVITTMISAVLFAIVFALIDHDVISFHRMSQGLAS
jgi:predicted secreted protein